MARLRTILDMGEHYIVVAILCHSGLNEKETMTHVQCNGAFLSSVSCRLWLASQIRNLQTRKAPGTPLLRGRVFQLCLEELPYSEGSFRANQISGLLNQSRTLLVLGSQFNTNRMGLRPRSGESEGS